MPGHHETVTVHIDQHRLESPNPTTGADLYALGDVAPGFELYRETTGPDEDEPIRNGPEEVRLKNGDHFHTGQHKTYTVYVNGQPKVVTTKTVTFSTLVELAFPTPPTGANILYTISYEDGPAANPEGALQAGGSVKVKNRMIFNVTATDQS